MKLAKKHALAMVGLGLLTGLANAGINPASVTPYLESATAATPYSQVVSGNSDPIRALTFDFTSAVTTKDRYAAVRYSLNSAFKRAKLAISIRGPMTNLLSVEVIDHGNRKYVFPLTRTAQAVDDEGWSRHVFPLAVLGNNTVAAIKLVVRPTTMNAQGTVYVRSVELLDTNALPSTADEYLAPTREFSNGVVASLAPALSYTGDHFRYLAYNFQSGATPTAGFDFQLPDKAFGTYVRFRARVDAAAALSVRVVDKNDHVFVIPVDRNRSASDAEGWATHSVDLSKAGAPGNKVVQPLKSIRLAVTKTTSTLPTGVAYFKDVDLVNQNPSPYRPLHEVPLLVISSVSAINATLLPSYGPPSDVIWQSRFNLSSSALQSGIRLTLSAEQQFTGKVIRFLAKVPKGYFLETVLKDKDGQAHELRITRPLSLVNEEGWVEYAVKVEPSKVSWPATPPVNIAPSKEIRILLRATGVEGVVFADAVSGQQSASFRGFRVDESQHALDLRSGTQVAQAWKPVDGLPLLRTGVGVGGLKEVDTDEAKDTGLNWARVVVEWGNAEKANGTFDFTNFRNYQGRIANLLARGMNVVVILAYNNTRYTADSKNGVVNQENRNAFVRYATATASMVQGLPRNGRVAFEIWNEQNDRSNYWLGDAEMATNYGKLLEQVAPAIQNVDKTFEVISGGLAQPHPGSQFDVRYLRALKNYLHVVDAIAYHPYEHNTPEFKGIETARIRDFLKAEGINKPLWITEAGTSSAMDGVDGLSEVNRQKQARVGVRHVLTSWGTDVPVHMIFALRDYWDDGEIPGEYPYAFNNSEHNFGLLDRKHAEKTARKGIRSLVELATGRKLEGLVNGSESRIQAMKFSATDKETAYVVWSNYSTPGEKGFFTTPLNCNTSIDLKGQNSSGSACVTDLAGNSIQAQCEAVEPSNPSTYRCSVSEEQGPVFVRMAR